MRRRRETRSRYSQKVIMLYLFGAPTVFATLAAGRWFCLVRMRTQSPKIETRIINVTYPRFVIVDRRRY